MELSLKVGCPAQQHYTSVHTETLQLFKGPFGMYSLGSIVWVPLLKAAVVAIWVFGRRQRLKNRTMEWTFLLYFFPICSVVFGMCCSVANQNSHVHCTEFLSQHQELTFCKVPLNEHLDLLSWFQCDKCFQRRRLTTLCKAYRWRRWTQNYDNSHMALWNIM